MPPAYTPGEFGVHPEDKSEVIYRIVDDSHTGLWQYDNNFVYVPFDELQRDLQMTEQETIDKDTRKHGVDPARTQQEIHIPCCFSGYDLNQVAAGIERAVNQVVIDHAQSGEHFFQPTG